MAEKKIRVKQIRSFIGRDRKTRRRLAALGFTKIGTVREFTASPALLGMLKSVGCVLDVREIK